MVVAEGQFGDRLEPQNFLLDTGTAPSIVNARLAKQLGLTTISTTVTAAGKTSVIESATPPEIQLGPIHARLLRVQVHDLSRLEQDLGIPIAAILGMDVLSKASFRLDYDKKRLEFSDISVLGIPVSFDQKTGLAVARVWLSGKPARMLLDTGSDQVALWRESLAGSDWRSLASSPRVGTSLTEHAVPVRVFFPNDLILGGERFVLEKAYFIPGGTETDFDGLLGVRALRIRAISYDPSRHVIYLQR
jgi:predicted aspartyl protease